MNILLLSTGGGGGNILRSFKTLFDRDVATAQQTDPKYAERLRRAITTRFLDTNEFSLASVPKEERVLIGAQTTRRVGSRHSPELARRAFEESRSDVERLIAKYSVVVLIGTGGKGTGAGTMFPIAEMARNQNKLVLPIFVRPSFERHEVDKRRYDHALHVATQFDAARIRLIEVLNDRAYSDSDPEPQSVVWERMNSPIARGLRGLLYVLWDLSQVDPSDLSILLAGPGRVRIGFAELTPADGRDPSDAEIDLAVRACWQNDFCVFSKPVGTSLVCIQGNWSNLADAKIKGGIASLALDSADPPYNPLYARALHTPRPWGVTAVFTEYTGVHDPLALDWSLRSSGLAMPSPASEPLPSATLEEPGFVQPAMVLEPVAPQEAAPVLASDRRVAQPSAAFETLWDFSRALNRLDRVALDLAARDARPEIMVDGLTVKKLLGTFWFRSVFPRLSESWRERLFDALAANIVFPNHQMRLGRRSARLKELTHEQIKEIATKTLVPGPAGVDLQLLLTIADLWGEGALGRLRFEEVAEAQDPSRLSALLGFRSSTS